ncbi:MAG: phage Gp37/Gp68 family protein [Clostridiales bacterium]|nr:phage Gp37/Gp68 family protein [Clostridiales bacterium]MCF8022320.1 phage Gp37/Gp68 family protein [Clostridiales bacterium]
MAITTKIQWTESTWNPVTGCSKVSEGCRNCYAERLAKRLKAMGNPRYKNGFRVTIHPDLVDLPLRWKKSRTIFVNSMSDLFHEEIPDKFIFEIFNTMTEANHHIFQVLTKRSNRLAELAAELPWPDNIWIGVTVENQDVINRIHDLKKTGAKVKFISAEPLIENLPGLPLQDIDWVIAGGETGPKARPMHASWVINILNQCSKKNIPFFFKHWGGTNKKKNGRLLYGRTWDEFPKKQSI